MNSKLTPVMQEAVDRSKDWGGKLYRHPGGFWSGPGFMQGRDVYFGTSTVSGLVMRGAATYTEWKDGRNGRFPIVATLTKTPATESGQPSA